MRGTPAYDRRFPPDRPPDPPEVTIPLSEWERIGNRIAELEAQLVAWRDLWADDEGKTVIDGRVWRVDELPAPGVTHRLIACILVPVEEDTDETR